MYMYVATVSKKKGNKKRKKLKVLHALKSLELISPELGGSGIKKKGGWQRRIDAFCDV